MICSNCSRLAVFYLKKECSICKKPININLCKICETCSASENKCAICMKIMFDKSAKGCNSCGKK